MLKVILIILAIVAVLTIGFICFMNSFGPDLKQYEKLKQPQISTMENQEMIEITLHGDPNVTAKKAIGELFSTFYKLKNNRQKIAAPRARWPVSFENSREDWVGVYGLPVSDTVKELPKQKNGSEIKLTIWEYGTVAEILHIGPYSTETTTIEKLKQYIKNNGYEIIGDHEEEYLKGPGLWPTNPKDYYTIIRYRIYKK